MKKLFTLSLSLFLLGTMVNAQSNTMVMIEEGTQASCPPCATQNPAFDSMLDANDDKVVVLKYQTWWPGFDQMYLDNEADVINRINYYGINGVPTGVMNGSEWANDCGYWEGAPICLTAAEINAAHAVISPLTMSIDAQLVNGTLTVSGSITADAALSGTLKLRIALAEQHITSAQAPGGTNGETDYYHVMKSFVGGPAGITLSNMNMGDVYTIDETMSVSGLTIYNFDELEVVAWVQNDADKVIHQAAKDQNVEIIVDAANNASAGSISGTPLVLCAGQNTLSPMVTIQNGGNEILTSCDITYSVNGGSAQIFNWTGALATLATELVTLDPITFTSNAVDASVIEVMVGNPNGMTDEVSTDNTSSISIDPAPGTDYEVQVTIVADAYGDEIYWQISNSADEVVASGGNPNVGLDNVGTGTFPPPFSAESYANNSTNVIDVTLPAIDCYTFHITDYYGDGLLGAGGYTLKDNMGMVMHNDVEDFQDESIKNFSGDATSGVSESLLSNGLTMSPNPVADNLMVNFNLATQAEVSITVVNALGQEVINEFLGTRTMGATNTIVDMSNLEAGIYYVSVVAGSESASRKISVVR